MTKVNAQKFVSLMPQKVPVNDSIEIFCKLDKMEDEQKKTGKEIEWENLKKDIEAREIKL